MCARRRALAVRAPSVRETRVGAANGLTRDLLRPA
jgi:hypothetical protein